MNSIMFAVDDNDMQYVDHSFAFVFLNIMEQLLNGLITFEDLDPLMVETLLFNIFPGGNTILHALHKRERLTRRLIEIAYPTVDDEVTIKYYAPIIPNFKKETCLHLLKS